MLRMLEGMEPWQSVLFSIQRALCHGCNHKCIGQLPVGWTVLQMQSKPWNDIMTIPRGSARLSISSMNFSHLFPLFRGKSSALLNCSIYEFYYFIQVCIYRVFVCVFDVFLD